MTTEQLEEKKYENALSVSSTAQVISCLSPTVVLHAGDTLSHAITWFPMRRTAPFRDKVKEKNQRVAKAALALLRKHFTKISGVVYEMNATHEFVHMRPTHCRPVLTSVANGHAGGTRRRSGCRLRWSRSC